MTLGSPDANGIGRYVESTPIGTEFSDYLNLGLESVSAAFTTIASSIFSELQLDTTNSDGRFIVQHGIGRIAGAAAAQISEAVTFPVAFASTPMIQCSHIGGRATGAFNPVGLTEVAFQTIGRGIIPSTTGFTAHIHRTDGANLSASFDYYYSWIAIGVAA
jgi:hypothetical protein